jgi:hypothetical protein
MLAVSAVLAGMALAVEPPSWVNLGNLSVARQVWDLCEIAGNSHLLAAGQNDATFDQAAVWRSTDRGVTWSRVLISQRNGTSLFCQMCGDAYERIWVVGSDGGSEALAYTADNGGTWNWVGGPPANPGVSGRSIVVIGDHLYHGGLVNDPYSISLYRLNVVTLEWELVVQYPQCNAITRLIHYNGRLLVFCRDRTTSAVRVFSYTPADMDEMARPVGMAAVTPASPAGTE